MLVKKSWSSKKGRTSIGILGEIWITKYEYTGWFLFGIIPVYIIRE
jgi:hypothetical protein